ncbi:MAG: DedA family protein [gamma proteobacterium endosymbiont of Lamellibrachia anaximandri]|nr:DedA family protein [gamma proteobacterium endosymbiont of Lamellibrachia anaximandri]MBL3618281.1 DedA family protein [gamma proteobacterium endosymbiont of Lamellibrachia anaximandri]
MDPTGPLTLFIGSFLASTLLPGGSEAMLLFAVHETPDSAFLFWTVVTLGNTLGGLSSWLIGWWLAKRFPGRGLKKAEQQKALARIAKHGGPALLFSWLPVVGDPLCLAAGWSGVRILPALVYISIGKAARYAVLLGVINGLQS